MGWTAERVWARFWVVTASRLHQSPLLLHPLRRPPPLPLASRLQLSSLAAERAAEPLGADCRRASKRVRCTAAAAVTGGCYCFAAQRLKWKTTEKRRKQRRRRRRVRSERVATRPQSEAKPAAQQIAVVAIAVAAFAALPTVQVLLRPLAPAPAAAGYCAALCCCLKPAEEAAAAEEGWRCVCVLRSHPTSRAAAPALRRPPLCAERLANSMRHALALRWGTAVRQSWLWLRVRPQRLLRVSCGKMR